MPIRVNGDSKRSATELLYKIFSKFGEIEDIAIGGSSRARQGGSKAFIKYAHRYYAEFAKEAMMDQVEVFQDQKLPLLIRWAVEGTGNPLDVEGEAERADFEIKQILNARKRARPQEDQPSTSTGKDVPQLSKLMTKR